MANSTASAATKVRKEFNCAYDLLDYPVISANFEGCILLLQKVGKNVIRDWSSYDHLFMNLSVQILDRIDQPLIQGSDGLPRAFEFSVGGSDMDGPYRTDIRQLSARKTVRCKPRLTGLDSGKAGRLHVSILQITALYGSQNRTRRPSVCLARLIAVIDKHWQPSILDIYMDHWKRKLRLKESHRVRSKPKVSAEHIIPYDQSCRPIFKVTVLLAPVEHRPLLPWSKSMMPQSVNRLPSLAWVCLSVLIVATFARRYRVHPPDLR
jgi:hypothetical protein